ncbi:hypothetical protein [Fibrobacter sp. UWB11]|uniref:hypothetical protein n=1 Tax=Fibrobacter sp. UWB11 TaxID=1896202 RepID=UPI0009290E23|nr:hypothetical protein [Fibrobacter sp. UWB11]SIO46543.1 hypothetical protein SAMN05720758_3100 [Fibrobacter sp. UWB11]
MVSVKRFIHDEPALFKASKAFVAQLFRCADPIVYVACKLSDKNEQIAWTLLGSALFQERSYPEILRLMLALHERFPGDKLWSLPVPKGGEIEEVVEQTFNSRNWSVFENVAGIFWSVGLFVRHHPDLVAWMRERTPEEMWRDLGEIYFMGRSNPRPKACAAIYRLIAPAPLGLGLAYRECAKMPPLPLTMGARRFLAMLGPAKEDNFSELDSKEKQKLANEFFVALAPENPYFAAHSLQFFLENGTNGFICRELTANCSECPLYEYCNYAEVRKRY